MTVAIGNGRSEVVQVPFIEHYPPDTTAAIFWLKNRRPDRWRDTQNIDHAVGHYVISEKPMTEEEWIRAHASNAADLDLVADAVLTPPKDDDK